MIIPIPIGTRNIVTVQGTIWKFVSCEKCQDSFAYSLDLSAQGEDLDLLLLEGDGSVERAREKAERFLALQGENKLRPLPCPHCGHYQANLARDLKDEASINVQQIIGGVLVLLSAIPVALELKFAWLLTSFIAVIGMTLLVVGLVKSLGYDANRGDAKERMQRGRRETVWGEQLTKLLETNPGAVQQVGTPPYRTADSGSDASL